MLVDIITDPEDLHDLEDAWDALLERSASGNFFLNFRWFRASWQHLANGGEMCVAVARKRGGPIVGIAPLWIQSREGFRRLGFVGPASYQDFILATEDRAQALEAILQALRHHSRWDIFELVRMPYNSPNFPPFQLAATGMEAFGEARPVDAAFHIELEGSWDTYWKGLSRTFRNDSIRCLRRLEAEVGKVSFTLAREPEEIAAYMSILMRHHITRRDARDYSVFRSPEHRNFYGSLTEAFSQTGELSLAAMQAGNRVAAVTLSFDYAGRRLGLILGFDEALAKYSVGRLQVLRAIEDSFKTGELREFDLGAGAEPYKLRFKPKIRRLYTITLCPVKPRGKLAHIWFNRIRPMIEKNSNARALRFSLLRAGIGKR